MKFIVIIKNITPSFGSLSFGEDRRAENDNTMTTNLFDDFNPISSKQWKQKIQFELNGADYNETLVWNSPEDIQVKPFYHKDEFTNANAVVTKATEFRICQNIFVYDVEKSIERALDTLNLLSAATTSVSLISINAALYQNAGANMVQQLAYSLGQANEYFNRIETINKPIVFEVAVGTNYFFEIAKLRALRLLFALIAKEYNHNLECNIIVSPTKRNKTLYDYNINMLRTTTECMSAIIGGADAIANLPYDALYHKDNEFGDRIARNQLLILKNESYFDKVNNPADGSYYIENLTNQLAEKALVLFKDIEANGGFLKQLNDGIIKRKIKESADAAQELFDTGKEILLGTNKHPNKQDKMKHDLELFPFVKVKPRKTLITPIIEKRLAEKIEQERLDLE